MKHSLRTLICLIALATTSFAQAESIVGKKDRGEIRVSEANGRISAQYFCAADSAELKLCDELGSFSRAELAQARANFENESKTIHGRVGNGLLAGGLGAVLIGFAYPPAGAALISRGAISAIAGAYMSPEAPPFVLEIAVKAVTDRYQTESAADFKKELKYAISWVKKHSTPVTLATASDPSVNDGSSKGPMENAPIDGSPAVPTISSAAAN